MTGMFGSKVVVATGYIPISGFPRSARDYELLGSALQKVRVPMYEATSRLDDCWLYEPATASRRIRHATGGNDAKNSLAYHIVQHQKTTWIVEALKAHPDADVAVWVDYGIFHQPDVTALVIEDFAARVGEEGAVAIPGCFDQREVSVDQPNWRFCGSSLVVPRLLAQPFDAAVRAVTLERLAKTAYITWEVNDWADVERRRLTPIRWYSANHDATQFTNYIAKASRT
jgi:hypothetical protein